MRLQVLPNTHPDYKDHKFNICAGAVPVAYSNNRLMAHRARIEIEKNLQPSRLTQAEIDTRPKNQEPQGTVRLLHWRAVKTILNSTVGG